jgi:hypothetical protein
MRTVVITPTLNDSSGGSGRLGDRGRVALLVVIWTAALYAIVGVAAARRESRPFGRIFARWDSAYYLGIARSGYEWKDDGRMHNPAFFPLYPLMIRAVDRSTRLDPATSGEAVSFAALLAAALLLADLTRREGFDPFASAGVMLMFPTAFFFLCVYSESLFLLMAVACLLASRQDRPGITFVFGALAALTRVNGVLLVIPLVWTWWAEDRCGRRLLAALGPPAGLAAVCVFDALKFGRPLAWLTVQGTGWHHSLTWPWRTISRGVFWQPHAYFSTAAALIFCVLTILLWKNQRMYALWLAANLALALSAGSMLSTGRYVVPLFPAFWPIGRAAQRSRLFRVAYLLAGIIGLGYDAVQFSRGFWVG